MKLNSRNTIFDDDVEIMGTEINGYLWATDEFCQRANYKGELETDDYINIYADYDVYTEKMRVEAQGYEKGKWFCRPIEITDAEETYILNRFIDYYFGATENFNDYVDVVRKEMA